KLSCQREAFIKEVTLHGKDENMYSIFTYRGWNVGTNNSRRDSDNNDASWVGVFIGSHGR
ncbi:hypothetical protein J6590_101565, partial [Homalodisca vitripennis]